MTRTALYTKLRAQCCDISGLTRKQLDAHAKHVEAVVVDARKRAKRAA